MEVPKCIFDKAIPDKQNQVVRLNFMDSAQTAGKDNNCNVQTERRL